MTRDATTMRPTLRALPMIFRRPEAHSREERSWFRIPWLIYLGFLFVPFISGEPKDGWLVPTLVSLPLFFALYFSQARRVGARRLVEILAIALLGYALLPANPYGNTYPTYTAAILPFVLEGMLWPLLISWLLIGILAAEAALVGQSQAVTAISAMIWTACSLGNSYVAEKQRKDAILRFSQDEIRRLAAVAERERIGRDLHDLLGHTLSLIAIKSELAGKLLERNRAAAAREIAEVMSVARDALKQVRTAVSGIRATALEAELASARALLECSGITVTCQRDAANLAADIESVMGMIVREATTNIHRHAGATRAEIHIACGGDRDHALLTVSDNGRGGITKRGNGLEGIRERVRAFGGTLDIDSPRGRGTELRVRLPVT